MKLLSVPSVIISTLYKVYDNILRILYKPRFQKIGKNVKFFPVSSDFIYKNIEVGNDVYIGPHASFQTWIAKLHIGNKVLFGPNVTIRGGNHVYYIPGRFIFDIKENEKGIDDDKDVFIEDDVWVGCNTTILKGVTIGRGSIVAAGAVVSKSCQPYSIIGGVPAKKIGNRFKTVDETIQHDSTLFPDNRIDIAEITRNFNQF